MEESSEMDHSPHRLAARRAVSAFGACLLAVATVSAAAAQESQRAGSSTRRSPLMDPYSRAMNREAPEVYQAKFETSKGDFVIEVHRDWAPLGADRFYNLVRMGFFDDCRFFRVISNFMVQFGLNGDPTVSGVWQNAHIKDDPVQQSNKRGFITFATAGPNTRTTQVFINFKDNAFLDGQGFAPFGQVVGDGMKVVNQFYADYGEGAPQGRGPRQDRISMEGNKYLMEGFPHLDYVKKASIVVTEE